jgi:hypothetical protein
MEKFKSRKFWLTLAANLFAGWLASKGNTEAAAAVASIATGSYSIGQGIEDAAKAKAGSVVNDAIEGFIGSHKG